MAQVERGVRHRGAVIVLYIVGGLLIVLGLIALVLPVVPPNIQAFVGQTQEQMDPRWVLLFFGMAKSIGVLYLAIGATVITLTAPLRRGVSGVLMASRTLLLPFVLIPIVMAPFAVGGPLVYPPIIVVLTAVALYLSRDEAARPSAARVM
jgi:hypothetical protein